MTKELERIADKYIKEYAERLSKIQNGICVINGFDYEKAFLNIKEAMLTKDGLMGKDVEYIQKERFHKELLERIRNRLLVFYLSELKQSDEMVIISLLRDKGTKGFSSLKGLLAETEGRYKDYRATEAQIYYIKTFNLTLMNEEDLSGREASEIIKCLRCKTRTRPKYFHYYLPGVV